METLTVAAVRWRAGLVFAVMFSSFGFGLSGVDARQWAAEPAEHEAVIAHSAEGVLLRTEPAFDARVLTVLPEGEGVDLRTDDLDTVLDPDGATRWWPVAADSGEGWVAGFFLELGDAVPAPAPASDVAVATWQASVGGSDGDEWNLVGAAFARVSDPDGVNVRAEPGLAAEAVRALAFEETVSLRVDVADTVYADGARWWPVGEGGVEGWVSGQFLSPADRAAPSVAADSLAASAEPAVPDQPKTATAVPLFAANSYVQVVTDDGGGLNMRADGAPDAERIGGLPEGEVAQVLDGFTVDPLGNPWYLVAESGVTGWVFGDYLVEADQPDYPDATEPRITAPTEAIPQPALPTFAIDAIVRVATDDRAGVNVRADADRAAPRVAAVPDGDAVRVAGGPREDRAGTPWYLIASGADSGWVRADFLVESAAPAASIGIATGSFRYPLEQFTLTQGFGCSPYWFEPWSANLGCNYHNALDLAVDAYTPILAADGGTVEQAGWCDCGLGYYVKIDHGNGFKTIYGHMAEMPYVRPGEAVGKGKVIGPIGSTGNSTGPHTHFTIQLNGADVDPLPYLE